MTPNRRPLFIAPLVLVIAACSTTGSGATADAAGQPDPTATDAAPSPSTASEAPVGPTTVPSSATTDPDPAVPVLDQAWATADLTDVATGETFRLADLAGRTVIIETMAIWCTNCRAQQGHVYEALEQLDGAAVSYVLIDVDPNETAAALAEYRDRNGFTGTYVVANADLARALAEEFGDQVLNPPSTPMILVGSDGRVTLTDFGQKSPDEIVALAQEHGA